MDVSTDVNVIQTEEVYMQELRNIFNLTIADGSSWYVLVRYTVRQLNDASINDRFFNITIK